MVKQRGGPSETATKNTILNRRNFLRLGLLFAGSAATGLGLRELFRHRHPGMQTPEKRTPVEEFLLQFPDRVPGVKDVKKFPVLNARHCLVHIRHMHSVENNARMFDSKVFTKEFLEKLSPEKRTIVEALRAKMKNIVVEAAAHEASVEADLAMTYPYLAEHQGMHTLYIEGMDEQGDAALKALQETLVKGMRVDHLLRDSIGRLPPQHPKRAALEQNLKETTAMRKNALLEPQRVLGSAVDLWAQGHIGVRAADKREILDKVFDLATDINRVNFPELLKKGQSLRELTLLMKASENTITFVRFGGNHKWWQRIQEWNSETPNDAFSLIEITPASYKECDMQK